MNKLFLIIFIPLIGLSQTNDDINQKRTSNNSQKTNNNMLHQSISNKIQNSANHNKRIGEKTNDSFKLAFGSSLKYNFESTLLDRVVEHKADLFIYLGSKNINSENEKYTSLSQTESFLNLRRNTPILAIWNEDECRSLETSNEEEIKEKYKSDFLNFFNLGGAQDSIGLNEIYSSNNYEINSLNIQVILLDGITFRSDLTIYNGDSINVERYSFYKQEYKPNHNPKATILGDIQWNWLANELVKPADLRIICTSTPFGMEWNGFESWANFPLEQQKMVDLIETTKAKGVFFISGGGPNTELSKIATKSYPLYDFSSSALSYESKFATPNVNRVEGPVMENNFGLITVDASNTKTKLKFESYDINNNQRFEYSIQLEDLRHN